MEFNDLTVKRSQKLLWRDYENLIVLMGLKTGKEKKDEWLSEWGRVPSNPIIALRYLQNGSVFHMAVDRLLWFNSVTANGATCNYHMRIVCFQLTSIF